MGLVIQTYPGQDALTKKSEDKTATSVYDRAIHKLCFIATKQELNLLNLFTHFDRFPHKAGVIGTFNCQRASRAKTLGWRGGRE